MAAIRPGAGCHHDHGCAQRQCLKRAFGEQHILRLIGIDGHDNQRRGRLTGGGSGRGTVTTRVLKALHRFRAHIKTNHAILPREQLATHGKAHGPKANKRDRIRRRHGGFQSDCGADSTREINIGIAQIEYARQGYDCYQTS
jgi:hypothetical protein